MQCICVLWKEKIEPGINLANQVCRWKDEMISVEIDMKITGIGCTVCKWQAKQEWHNSVINNTMPSRMQQETKLLHSNIATKHMAVMYSRCLKNMNSELSLNHTRTGSNKHGKSAKDISFTDLGKILTCQELTSGSNVENKQTACYRNIS